MILLTNASIDPSFRHVDETKKEIMLNVKPENVPVTQGGDGYATNVKAAVAVESKLGIKAPMSRCASHGSQGIYNTIFHPVHRNYCGYRVQEQSVSIDWL